MKRLHLMIRRQELAVALLKQRLHELRERRRALAQMLDRHRTRAAATRQYLQELLDRTEALPLDVLRLAQLELVACLQRIEPATAELAVIDTAVEAAVTDAAHGQARLDKLRERLEQQRGAEEARQIQLGWQMLDEWVLNKRGSQT